MGGVATGVRNDEAGFVLKTAEGITDENEFIITHHAQFLVPINIINIYGNQEGRTSNDDIKDNWNVILENVSNIERANEEVVLIGDMNKLVGNGEYGIKDNNPKVSFGGTLIHDLLKTEKYIILNSSEKCIGGPFTRIDPSNPDIKSCLDLCIISKGLLKYVVELVIDDGRLFTPHRAVRNKLIYSDHLSIHVKFKGILEVIRSYQKDGKLLSWNTNKENGWQTYKSLTSNCDKLEE